MLLAPATDAVGCRRLPLMNTQLQWHQSKVLSC